VDLLGLSPLGFALLQKRADIAELLRQRGANENLFDAVFTGDLKSAAALLTLNKSLVSRINMEGESVVMAAVETGHADILQLMLDNGASPNAEPSRGITVAHGMPSAYGESPLHVAAISNQTNTAQLLLQHGADVETYDNYGLTPLHWAVLRASPGVAELLLKNKTDPNKRVGDYGTRFVLTLSPRALSGDTALHLAALRGDTNIIEMLLKSGAVINLTNEMGKTALDLASQPGLPPEFFSIPPSVARMFQAPRAGEATFTNSPASLIERRKAAASMLEASGGK
jgi:ankyrin repeat protein